MVTTTTSQQQLSLFSLQFSFCGGISWYEKAKNLNIYYKVKVTRLERKNTKAKYWLVSVSEP